MIIEYLTQSSLLFRYDKAPFLTDPFSFPDELTKKFMISYPPFPHTKKHIGKIKYLHSSHIHDDHCHTGTLLQLRDQTDTVVIPTAKLDVEKRYRECGYKKFIFLENEKTVVLPDGIRLTNYHDMNYDTALVLEFPGCTVLHGNDCKLNENTFRRMAKRFKIDYAFFPYTECQELYPLILPRSDDLLTQYRIEKENAGTQYVLSCLEIIKPRIVIPYGYTVAYFKEDQWKLNGYARVTPTMFKKICHKNIPHQECWDMQPGDRIDTGKNRWIKIRKENLWGENIDDYVRNIAEYSKANLPYSKPEDLGNMGEAEDLLENFMTQRMERPFPEDLGNQVIAVHILSNSGKKTYYIDTGDNTFSETSDKCPMLEISMPAIILKELIIKNYHAFSVLFTYKVSFQLNIILGLSPEAEAIFYTMAVITLFDPDLHETMWEALKKEKHL